MNENGKIEHNTITEILYKQLFRININEHKR